MTGRCGTRVARDRVPALTELGLPHTHDEEWRFTNVAPIARLVGML